MIYFKMFNVVSKFQKYFYRISITMKTSLVIYSRHFIAFHPPGNLCFLWPIISKMFKLFFCNYGPWFLINQDSNCHPISHISIVCVGVSCWHHIKMQFRTQTSNKKQVDLFTNLNINFFSCLYLPELIEKLQLLSSFENASNPRNVIEFLQNLILPNLLILKYCKQILSSCPITKFLESLYITVNIPFQYSKYGTSLWGFLRFLFRARNRFLQKPSKMTRRQ